MKTIFEHLSILVRLGFGSTWAGTGILAGLGFRGIDVEDGAAGEVAGTRGSNLSLGSEQRSVPFSARTSLYQFLFFSARLKNRFCCRRAFHWPSGRFALLWLVTPLATRKTPSLLMAHFKGTFKRKTTIASQRQSIFRPNFCFQDKCKLLTLAHFI